MSSVGKPQGVDQQGIALVMAFSISLLVMGLIVSLYWVAVQRHVLLKQRVEHARNLYLAEAGMNDAIARLRAGLIDRNLGTSYCLDPETSATTACAAPLATHPVRVVISPADPGTGRNQIDVTTLEF